MVEKIKSIDWASLDNAYNDSSEEIIILLTRAYQQKDSASCDELLNYLNNNLIHQGTIYNSTIKTLPFAIDLLSRCPDECVVRLYRFIIGVADGIDQYFFFMDDINKVNELPGELLFLAEGTNMLWNHFELFKKQLHHPNKEIRRLIPYLLNRMLTLPKVAQPQWISIPSLTEQVAGSAITQIGQENDSFTRCSLVFMIRSLAHKNEMARQSLLVLLAKEDDPLVKIFLGIALAEHKYYDESLSILQQSLQNISATDQLYNNELPWHYGWLRVLIIHAMCKFPFSYCTQLIPSFLNVITIQNKHTAAGQISPVLGFVFQERKFSSNEGAAVLSADERKILLAIYTHGHLLDSDVGNTSIGYIAAIGIDDRKSTWEKILGIK